MGQLFSRLSRPFSSISEVTLSIKPGKYSVDKMNVHKYETIAYILPVENLSTSTLINYTTTKITIINSLITVKLSEFHFEILV
jgi:hypothetical protein